MAVNDNLMLFMVLLWIGTLPLVNPKYHSYMPERFMDRKDCEKYILPMHAMWAPRARCQDDKRYQCLTGYRSQVQTNCKNGDWVLEPTCQVLGCPQGENISKSNDVTESRMFGGYFTFNCSVGYTRKGETGTLKCGERGFWTEHQACEALECPPGVNITDSDDVTEARIVGSLFRFNCPATNLTGTLTCDANGQWHEQIPCPRVLRSTYVYYPTYRYYRDETDCTEECVSDTSCGFALNTQTPPCTIYRKPLILIDNTIETLSRCIQICKDDKRCRTLSYYQTRKLCDLFEANYQAIDETFYIYPDLQRIMITGF